MTKTVWLDKNHEMTVQKIFFASVFSFILLTSSLGHAAEDQLFLKNGDRLSGEITSYNKNIVIIETGFGTLNVDSNNIGGVASPNYDLNDFQFNEELSVTKTTAAPTPAIAEANEEETIKAGPLGAIWNGEVNFGGELETGNGDQEAITIDGEIIANWNDIHRVTASADYEWEQESGDKVTDELELASIYDYFFAERWFLNNRVSYEQDAIEDLDYRIIATTGLGYQIFDTDTRQLEVTFGPGYEREEYNGQDAEDSATANWALNYDQNVYAKLLDFYHNHTLNSPLDDFSSYLFESETGIKIPFGSGLTAGAEVEFDWNNDPATGEQEDDTTYALTLGYAW
jgi:putative salt-induced outer membrane protein YdiY